MTHSTGICSVAIMRCLLGTTAVTLAYPALAQTVSPVAPTAEEAHQSTISPLGQVPGGTSVGPAPVVAETSSGQLEEIVVTAQRREESAQKVPVSITAISGDALKAGSIKGLDGLTKGIVGIQYDSGSTQRPELYIRGIGTNRFDIGSDPSSGVFIDEIYQPRFANVLSGLQDVERIEILRGPQGTLFGRNTIGGAISVATAEPQDKLGGFLSGSYGNKNYVNGQGTITGPLVSDKILGRITVGYSDRNGFLRDTVSGKDDGVKSFTARGKLLFKLSDDLTLKLTGAHFYSHQRALLLDPQNTPFFLAGPLTPQVIDNNPFSGAYTNPGGNTIHNTQINGRLEWSADALTTTVIGSWIHFNQNSAQDLDGSRNSNIFYRGHERSNTYSAELRFSSTNGGFLTLGDHLRWVAGVFAFKDKGYDIQDFTTGTDSIISFLIANPTLTPPFNLPTVSKTDSTNLYSDLKSLAVYAQGTYSITDKLGVTLGGRYTHDERDFTFVGITPTPGLPLVPANFTYPGKVTSPKFTPRVALEYKPIHDVLLYASWSRGFKSSAVQSTAITPEVASSVTKPETVDAYEIGFKSEFLNRRVRLNISLFDNEFKDLQVRRVVTFPSGFSTAISENAATSTIRGVEVEGSALLARGLRVNASYAYLDAKYNRYIADATAGLDLSGNRLPRAPKNRFNVDATYTTLVAGQTELQLRAAYNYTGSFFFQPENLPLDKEKPYGLTDISLQLTLPNRTTNIQGWARNIFNVTYRNYLDPLAAELLAGYGDRRTYGVTLSQKF